MGPFEPPSVYIKTGNNTTHKHQLVELITASRWRPLSKKGVADGLAPGQCPRVQHLKPLSVYMKKASTSTSEGHMPGRGPQGRAVVVFVNPERISQRRSTPPRKLWQDLTVEPWYMNLSSASLREDRKPHSCQEYSGHTSS